MYSVVFHPCYYGPNDSGYRLYMANDPYLEEHPGMYGEREDFQTLKAAQQYMADLNREHNVVQDKCRRYDAMFN